MSRPLWGHPVGHDDPACRRRFPPWRAGEPPTKVGGLRGDILFKSKEYPLALPKKDSRGDGIVTSFISLAAAKRAPAHSFRCSSFSHRKTLRWEPCDFPLTTPLKRPKEGLRPFLWEPSWGLRGIGGCGPAGDQGCGRFAARLRGTLGRGSGTPSRRALRKVYRSSGSGPMYLRHGFRRPNFVPKFGASVIGIGPYGTRRGAAASAGAAL